MAALRTRITDAVHKIRYGENGVINLMLLSTHKCALIIICAWHARLQSECCHTDEQKMSFFPSFALIWLGHDLVV